MERGLELLRDLGQFLDPAALGRIVLAGLYGHLARVSQRSDRVVEGPAAASSTAGPAGVAQQGAIGAVQGDVVNRTDDLDHRTQAEEDAVRGRFQVDPLGDGRALDRPGGRRRIVSSIVGGLTEPSPPAILGERDAAPKQCLLVGDQPRVGIAPQLGREDDAVAFEDLSHLPEADLLAEAGQASRPRRSLGRLPGGVGPRHEQKNQDADQQRHPR